MTAPPDIDRLRSEFLSELDGVARQDDLKDLHDRYLGRKRGAVPALLKTVATAPPDQRRALGGGANALKKEIEQALEAKREGPGTGLGGVTRTESCRSSLAALRGDG